MVLNKLLPFSWLRPSEIATTMYELAVADKVAGISLDPEKLKVLFKEMTQMCLWCVINISSSFE